MMHTVCEADVQTIPLPPEVVCGGAAKPMFHNHLVLADAAYRPTKTDKLYSDAYNTTNIIKVIAVKDSLDPMDNRENPFIIQLDFRKGDEIIQTQAKDENGFCFGYIMSSAFFGSYRLGFYKPGMVEMRRKKKKTVLRKLFKAIKKK